MILSCKKCDWTINSTHYVGNKIGLMENLLHHSNAHEDLKLVSKYFKNFDELEKVLGDLDIK